MRDPTSRRSLGGLGVDRGVVRVRRPVGERPVVAEAGARIDARDFMHERDAVLDRTDQRA